MRFVFLCVAALAVLMVDLAAAMTCPVCSMAVKKENSYNLEHGQEVLFCSHDHVNKFSQEPAHWFAKENSVSHDEDHETHDHDHHNAEGGMDMPNCPVCGMMVMGDDKVAIKGDQNVYACSAGCAGKLREDMNKYTEKPNPTPTPTPSNDDDSYCTDATVMGNGFGADTDTCVLLLFDGWALNSAFKFFLGCIGVFFASVLLEYLASLRHALSGAGAGYTEHWAHSMGVDDEPSHPTDCRGACCAPKQEPQPRGSVIAAVEGWIEGGEEDKQVTSSSPLLGGESSVKGAMESLKTKSMRRRLAVTALHGICTTLGYFIMLVSMTFNGWLFAMAILGFAAGHFFFGPLAQQAAGGSCEEPRQNFTCHG